MESTISQLVHGESIGEWSSRVEALSVSVPSSSAPSPSLSVPVSLALPSSRTTSSGSAVSVPPSPMPSAEPAPRPVVPLPKAVYRTRQSSGAAALSSPPATVSAPAIAAATPAPPRQSRSRIKAVSFRSAPMKPKACLRCAQQKRGCSFASGGPRPCVQCGNRFKCKPQPSTGTSWTCFLYFGLSDFWQTLIRLFKPICVAKRHLFPPSRSLHLPGVPVTLS
jgi:hypothetical protein